MADRNLRRSLVFSITAIVFSTVALSLFSLGVALVALAR